MERVFGRTFLAKTKKLHQSFRSMELLFFTTSVTIAVRQTWLVVPTRNHSLNRFIEALWLGNLDADLVSFDRCRQ